METKCNKTIIDIRDSEVNWQKILAQGFRSSQDLLNFLHLPASSKPIIGEKQFATRVPLSFANRMQKKNPLDPLLLQVLASDTENQFDVHFSADPLKEKAVNPVPGLIHKYYGRVLLTLTTTCAINCRYCFRRHFPYTENNPGRRGWQKVYDYITNDTSIHEVILSGGDPLLASDSLFAEIIENIANIAHVQSLRIHSRIPIVLPERITPNFLSILTASRLQKIVVLHCNHAQEFDKTIDNVCATLKDKGCHLLNQSVLLAGINDSVETLAALSMRLFQAQVLPYYLHLLDKVQGAMHFDIPLTKALKLYTELQNKLPGYLVPRLVREEAGKASKTLINLV